MKDAEDRQRKGLGGGCRGQTEERSRWWMETEERSRW